MSASFQPDPSNEATTPAAKGSEKSVFAGSRSYIVGNEIGYATRVDLGSEPPIELFPLRGPNDFHDHRRLSLNWLLGTVMTGICGAGLLTAAIYAALERQSNVAVAPTLLGSSRGASGNEQMNPNRGDRLVRNVDIAATKQTYKIPITVKSGDREVVRQGSFIKVSAQLTLGTLGFSDEVPAFNPLNLLGDTRNASDPVPDAGPMIDDAEVSFATHDLSAKQPGQAAAELSDQEIGAQIIEFMNNYRSSKSTPSLQLPSQLMLMRTSRANLDQIGRSAFAPAENTVIAPFSSIQVHMVAENITQHAKSDTAGAPSPVEQLVVGHKGESLEDVLRNAHVSRDDIRAVLAAYGPKKTDLPIAEGKKFKLQYDDFNDSGRNSNLARLTIYENDRLSSSVAAYDNGVFVPLAKTDAVVAAKKPSNSDEDNGEDENDGMQIYASIYETALKQSIPHSMIDELVRIFANDIDFQRSVSPGDALEVFYSEPDEYDNKPELLFASITYRGESFKYYRFQTPDANVVDYYDENGRSTRKFLIRVPIANARSTSPFGYRYHPILGYRKFHSGQDWAAPIGTPIVASGNGLVLKAAWDSGYGRRVEIQHANGYVTTYNHLSGFARGVTEGARVRQGQLIGYLGQSGLATGPHLHYEVLINGNFVDPMRVKLANTREFDGRLLASFKHERDRIDGLMTQAPNSLLRTGEARIN